MYRRHCYIESNMNGLEEFAQELTSFLETKYFHTGEDSDVCAPSITGNYKNNLRFLYTKDIGIAVLMLSYTFRSEFKRRFNNVQFFFQSRFNFTAFVLKFAETYFKNPSIFKVLIICSLVSELGIHFITNECSTVNYNYYVSNSLEFVLHVVCSDYIMINGGWKALDAVAKTVSSGYETLQSVIDKESPFHTEPITKALRCNLSRRNKNMESEKTKIDQFKSTEKDEKLSDLVVKHQAMSHWEPNAKSYKDLNLSSLPVGDVETSFQQYSHSSKLSRTEKSFKISCRENLYKDTSEQRERSEESTEEISDEEFTFELHCNPYELDRTEKEIIHLQDLCSEDLNKDIREEKNPHEEFVKDISDTEVLLEQFDDSADNDSNDSILLIVNSSDSSTERSECGIDDSEKHCDSSEFGKIEKSPSKNLCSENLNKDTSEQREPSEEYTEETSDKEVPFELHCDPHELDRTEKEIIHLQDLCSEDLIKDILGEKNSPQEIVKNISDMEVLLEQFDDFSDVDSNDSILVIADSSDSSTERSVCGMGDSEKRCDSSERGKIEKSPPKNLCNKNLNVDILEQKRPREKSVEEISNTEISVLRFCFLLRDAITEKNHL